MPAMPRPLPLPLPRVDSPPKTRVNNVNKRINDTRSRKLIPQLVSTVIVRKSAQRPVTIEKMPKINDPQLRLFFEVLVIIFFDTSNEPVIITLLLDESVFDSIFGINTIFGCKLNCTKEYPDAVSIDAKINGFSTIASSVTGFVFFGRLQEILLSRLLLTLCNPCIYRVQESSKQMIKKYVRSFIFISR